MDAKLHQNCVFSAECNSQGTEINLQQSQAGKRETLLWASLSTSLGNHNSATTAQLRGSDDDSFHL